MAPSAEVVEPVASVHRFEGQFLGTSGDDLIRYVPTGEGRAVVCGPTEPPIPPADGQAPDSERYRTPVPAGKAVRHGSAVFVLAPRELLALNAEGQPDWRFILPGKADAPDGSEQLTEVLGFDGDAVRVLSRVEPPDPAGDRPARVYTLATSSGRLLRFDPLPGKLGPVTPVMDVANRRLYATTANRLVYFELDGGRSPFGPAPVPVPPDARLVPVRDGVLVGSGMFQSPGRGWQKVEFGPGDPTVVPAVAPDRGVVYAGFRVRERPEAETFVVRAVHLPGGSPAWSRPVAGVVTARPVVTETSLYVVGGTTLYRLDRQTGAVGWRLSLSLAPTESVTDLTLAGNELQATGPGFVVRVKDRAAPAQPGPPPVPAADAAVTPSSLPATP